MAQTATRYVEWRSENRERLAAYQREYYQKNREKLLEKNRLRAKERGYNKSNLSNLDYREMVIGLLRQRDGDTCPICDELIYERFSIDHIQPRNMGGSNDPENLRLAHYSCNHTRPRGNKIWRGQPIS